MAIGRYLTDAINQSITNERMSMRDRFSQEIQQRRYDEANAYRDKGFMENVRQFQLGHALRQAADKRAQLSLDDQLKTSQQLRNIRGLAEERNQSIYDFNYGPDGYMHEKRDREGELHKQDKDIYDFNYGEDGLKHLQKNLLNKQIDAFGKPQPMTKFQEKHLGPYYDKLAANLGKSSNPFKVPTYLQSRNIATEESALKGMKDYLNSNATIWDFSTVGAGFGPPFSSTMPFRSHLPWSSPDPEAKDQLGLIHNLAGHTIEDMGREFNGNDPLALMRLYTRFNAFWNSEYADKMKDIWQRQSGLSGYDLFKVVRDEFEKGAVKYINEKYKPQNSNTQPQSLLDVPLN